MTNSTPRPQKRRPAIRGATQTGSHHTGTKAEMTFEQQAADLGFLIERLETDITHLDYVYVEFPRTGGRPPGKVALPYAALSPKVLLASLKGSGADLSRVDEPEDFVTNLLDRLPPEAGILTDTIGWKTVASRRSFLLPSQTFGSSEQRIVLSEAAGLNCLAVAKAGTLKGWKETVAAPAKRSACASMAILTAMSGPFLTFSGLPESFILNFAGNSSSGKSTANAAGASVWGDPTTTRNWSASDRGIVELAAANSCTCLVLDDAEKAAVKANERLRRVADLTHALTSGQSKTYAKFMESKLPQLNFECLVLSSSPQSIEAGLAELGVSRTNGDRVRLLEMQVPHGDTGGIWVPFDAGDSPRNTQEMSRALRTGAMQNYGHPGRKLLKYLVENQSKMPAKVQKLMKDFEERVAQEAGSVQGRIKSKIALTYAAGCIARKAGVLPWSKADVLAVCEFAYHSVTATAFSATTTALGEDFDPKSVLRLLKKAMRDKQKFPRLQCEHLTKATISNDAIGYIWPRKRRAYLMGEAFQKIIGGGRNPLPQRHYDAVVELLVTSGALLPNGEKITRDVRIGPENRKWLVFDGDKLNELWTTSLSRVRLTKAGSPAETTVH